MNSHHLQHLSYLKGFIEKLLQDSLLINDLCCDFPSVLRGNPLGLCSSMEAWCRLGNGCLEKIHFLVFKIQKAEPGIPCSGAGGGRQGGKEPYSESHRDSPVSRTGSLPRRRQDFQEKWSPCVPMQCKVRVRDPWSQLSRWKGFPG